MALQEPEQAWTNFVSKDDGQKQRLDLGIYCHFVWNCWKNNRE
jgi:hypothetical protein